jgi:pSer/pThr/pTyr-binding forkhead associated (FHA) protein
VDAPGGNGLMASVTVLEGPRGMVGQTIRLTKPVVVVGRNPSMADVVFYPDEASSISRAHATFTLEGGQYQLMDNGSSNGTRVNGQPLMPRMPVALRDGDQIALGDMAKLGVKLRFNHGGGGQADVSDRTFIVEGWEKDELDQFKDG